MISAYADIVCFPYSPWQNASQNERERGLVSSDEFELIFAKTRSSAKGTGEIFMDLSTMSVR